MWVPRSSHKGRNAAMAMAAPTSTSSMSPRTGIDNSLRPMIETIDMAIRPINNRPPAMAKP
ncbi:hypothetical protein D3C85_1491600 [compost metagenome]